MAKISILSTDAGRTFTAGANDEIIGTATTADSIYVDASANGVVVSGNGGGDVITMAGSVNSYTVSQDGSRIVLTNATGGETFISVSSSATTINFDDATAVAVDNGTNLMFGTQVVTGLTAPAHITGTSIFTGDGVLNSLTPGHDVIMGTAGNDTFTGYIWDNQNTLQSGDIINGGAGTDTLNAEIGDSQAFAIGAKTTSVENVFIQAQANAHDSSDNYVDDPYNPYWFSYENASHDGNTQIDAQAMHGVRQIWSDNSRSNLVVEDVREDSHLTTIGMRDTDPGDVNYEVYFDPQHITGPGANSEGATLTIRLADVLDLGKDGNGLSNLPYSGLTLNIGGNNVTLAIDFASLTSYADFKTAIENALVAAGITGITVSESPAETAVFSITVTDAGTTYLQGSVGGLYNPIVLTNSGSEAISLVDYTLDPGTSAPSGNLVQTAAINEPDTIPSLTQVDVILDNVARGDASGSGDLVIGDMSMSGIQQFNVQVDRSSHIDQMASTNNVLEVVNVENIGANGDLIINQLNDVRVFDAHTMVGDVSLNAYLSGYVTEKYLNLTDTQADPAADNSEILYRNVESTKFMYDLGTGNDNLDLAISSDNMDTAGTTNREDFVLNINGGAGNDNITLSVVDNDGDLAWDGAVNVNPFLANWYDNSILNANLTIDAGAGDDIVTKPGTGNVVIGLGTGNDTVYADNTGDKATFVFNVAPGFDPIRADINNLQSDTNDTYRLYKGTLTVDYKGFEVSVTLPSTNGVVSDLQVNQAIKEAINGNYVLNKMLEAHDGPANTLVVSALIDTANTAFDPADLTVSIAAPTSLSSADVTLLNSYYHTTGGVMADHLLTFNNSVAAFDLKGDYDTNMAWDNGRPMFGDHSIHTSDNIITGDTGNDVIVLGTGLMSNDTVVYHGYDSTANGLNDNDTIVNFDTTWYAEQTHVLVNPSVSPTYEQVTLTFSNSDGSPAAETIIFDGQTVTLSAPATQGVIPAADVTYQFAQQFDSANWHVVSSDLAAGTVLLQNNTPGNMTDVVAGDFTGTYVEAAATGGGATIGVAVTQQGSIIYDGQHSQFTVDFSTPGTAVSVANGSFDFAAVAVNYVQGDGSITLTNDVMAQAGAYATAGWTVTQTGDTEVTFTAINSGATAIGTAANFDLGTNTIVGSIAGTVGTADVTTAQYTTIPAGPGAGIDYLDFSSYNVNDVFVNSDTITGAVAGDGLLAANENYVYMVESATNDGQYTMYLMNTGSTAGFGGLTLDTTVGVIGVADFGVEQPFVADNFIL